MVIQNVPTMALDEKHGIDCVGEVLSDLTKRGWDVILIQ